MQKVRFSLGKKRFSVNVHETGFFRRGTGLMFRSSNTNNLLFVFPKARRVLMTALFVFFPFMAVWLDNKGRVVDLAFVHPFVFSFSPRVKANYLLELPYNAKNAALIAFLVGKIKRFK